jgi:LysR substrate binding domain
VFTHDQAGALRDGTADFALLCVHSDDLAGLETTEVTEEYPVALLTRDHRLARRAIVTTAELHQEPAYQEQCPPTGLDEILDRVALGRLIAVVGSGAADRLTREVTAVPVADLPPTTLALGWLPRAARPEIVSFARPSSASPPIAAALRACARWRRKQLGAASSRRGRAPGPLSVAEADSTDR